ncbi:MAG: NADH-quinone oxidoreductase subunit C [Actinobacteria bacterium]|nr:NADH-quinone oxidoreductase subunit C [Actinomycetota bacterium]
MIENIEQLYLKGKLAKLLLEEEISRVPSGREVDVKVLEKRIDIKLDGRDLIDVLKKLRESEKLSFDFLDCIICYQEKDNFSLIYLIYSTETWQTLNIKAVLSAGMSSIESVTSIYPAAFLMEHEIFEMYGIDFEGVNYDTNLFLTPGDSSFPMRRNTDG